MSGLGLFIKHPLPLVYVSRQICPITKGDQAKKIMLNFACVMLTTRNIKHLMVRGKDLKSNLCIPPPFLRIIFRIRLCTCSPSYRFYITRKYAYILVNTLTYPKRFLFLILFVSLIDIHQTVYELIICKYIYMITIVTYWYM